jgi:hypothetical protein
VVAISLLTASCRTATPIEEACPIPVEASAAPPADQTGPFEQVDVEGRIILVPDDGIRFPDRGELAPAPAQQISETPARAGPPACCPAAPNGWRFAYYLAPQATRSIKPQFGRCAYRRIADDNDAMVALIDTNKGNAIVEVERVLTRNALKFDIVATLTDRGMGVRDPNCQVCHSLTAVAPTPAGHYIYMGRNLPAIINANPAAGTVVGFNKLGQPVGNRKALRNKLAPY